MASALETGSTSPEFITEFNGTAFPEEPVEGGGVFAASEDTNILVFPETNDVGTGGGGTDVLQGNEGDDNLQGGAGDDFLFGSEGDDIVRGDAGDDVIVGAAGSDIAIGGTGTDIFEFFDFQFEDGDTDLIQDFEVENDSVVIVGTTDVTFNDASGIVSVDGVEAISIDPGLDLDVLIRDNSAVLVSGDALNFDDATVTESEGDVITPSLDTSASPVAPEPTGSPSPSLGEGSTSPEFITDFSGTAFPEEPVEGGGIFAAAEDTNILIFPETNDVGTGGDGTDVLQGNEGDDNLQGAAGDDFVFGSAGDDIVRGDAGDDVIVGGAGSDIAIGGTGTDIFEFFDFQFETGDIDLIRDFEVGIDSVVVVGTTDVSFDDANGIVSVDGVEAISLAPALGLDVLIRDNSAVIS